MYRTDPMDPFSTVFFTAKVSATGALDGGYGTRRRGHVIRSGYTFAPPGRRDRTGRVDHVHDARRAGSRPTVRSSSSAPLVSSPARSTSPLYDTALVPAGCSPMGGYAVRGVVRPTATQEIHVGKAIVDLRQSERQERVVLTSQTVGTDDHQLVGDAADRRDRRVRRTMAIDLVGSDVVFDTRRRRRYPRASLHDSAGAPVSGWGAGGVATLAAGFGEVGWVHGARRRAGSES